ncbi:MAG: hypothetical protein CML02_20030 [Pseudooceanicola sp.]|jgi:hypothetical protein|nr:hypothetical protein [Pseudooceanicola sp.]|tara:strand:+ start:1756 stop:2331 length:576 start_codon:yes stop_codon:yes gene_type:complete
MTAGIGHNNGPVMETGQTYRAYQWRQAQRALMPEAIPLQIVRMRMRRATELGMSYKAYASVRRTSGHDILGLLFSSNALRIIGNGARMPEDERARLEAVVKASKLAMVHRPNHPGVVLAQNRELDATDAAPLFTDSWSAMRARLEQFVQNQQLPGNRVLVVGDAPLESEWATAARAAGYLPADAYFAQLLR